MPGRFDESTCDTDEDCHRGEGIRAVMPCIGHNQLTFNAPPNVYGVVIKSLFNCDGNAGPDQGESIWVVFSMTIDIQAGLYAKINGRGNQRQAYYHRR